MRISSDFLFRYPYRWRYWHVTACCANNNKQ